MEDAGFPTRGLSRKKKKKKKKGKRKKEKRSKIKRLEKGKCHTLPIAGGDDWIARSSLSVSQVSITPVG